MQASLGERVGPRTREGRTQGQESQPLEKEKRETTRADAGACTLELGPGQPRLADCAERSPGCRAEPGLGTSCAPMRASPERGDDHTPSAHEETEAQRD